MMMLLSLMPHKTTIIYLNYIIEISLNDQIIKALLFSGWFLSRYAGVMPLVFTPMQQSTTFFVIYT